MHKLTEEQTDLYANSIRSCTLFIRQIHRLAKEVTDVDPTQQEFMDLVPEHRKEEIEQLRKELDEACEET